MKIKKGIAVLRAAMSQPSNTNIPTAFLAKATPPRERVAPRQRGSTAAAGTKPRSQPYRKAVRSPGREKRQRRRFKRHEKAKRAFCTSSYDLYLNTPHTHRKER